LLTGFILFFLIGKGKDVSLVFWKSSEIYPPDLRIADAQKAVVKEHGAMFTK
jgi:hypothetical protein